MEILLDVRNIQYFLGYRVLSSQIQYFLHLVLFPSCAFLVAVFVLGVLLSPFVYLLYLMFICCKHMCICCTSYVYFLYLMCICFTSYVYLLYLTCICFALYIFVIPYVYLLCYVCICCAMCVLCYVCIVLTLDAGLLARSQYPEGPATGHIDTGFSWFPSV